MQGYELEMCGLFPLFLLKRTAKKQNKEQNVWSFAVSCRAAQYWTNMTLQYFLFLQYILQYNIQEKMT